NKICQYTAWNVGHCYLNNGNGQLYSSDIWNYNLSNKYLEFKERSKELSYSKGSGVIGKTFAQGKSFWLDINEDNNDEIYNYGLGNIREFGLNTLITAPIMKQTTPIGVMEFYKTDDERVDSEILECITNIGIELGSLAERIEILEQIKVSEKQFKAVADTANDSILTINQKGKIVYINKSSEKIFGYSDEELLNEDLSLLIPENYMNRYKSVFKRAFASGELILQGRTFEFTGKAKNNKEFPIELSIAKWEINNEPYITAMVKDITLRKEIEKELIEKQKMLEEAQQIAKLGSWEWDVKNNFLSWSRELFSIYELNSMDFKPTYEGFLVRVHPENVENVKKIIQKALENKKPFSFYHKIITPSGKTKTLKAQGEVYTDDEGNVTRMFGTSLDITEITETEEKIRESEKRLKNAQKIAKLGSWELDLKDGKVLWSDEMYEILELEVGSEIKSEQFNDLISPEDLKYREEEIEKAIKSNRPFNFFFTINFKSGKRKILNTQGEVYKDKNGNPTRMIGTIMDVTEIKEAEEKIKSSEKQLNEAQHIAKLGSWELNLKSNEVTWSDEMYRIFELEKGDTPPAYEDLWQWIHPDDIEKVDKASSEVLNSPPSLDLEYRIITKAGKLKYLSADILAEFNESIPVRLYGSIQDITDIKLVEEQLRKTNEKLIEAQKELIPNEKMAQLGKFYSGIAHEIRNPLANISALSQLLTKANLDDKSKKHLKYILVNADIANKIIKDLLNFASPEDLVFHKEDLKESLDNILESVEARCLEQNIKI